MQIHSDKLNPTNKWMKKVLFFLGLFLFAAEVLISQSEVPATYWIQLKDKNGTQFQISHPEEFLSTRAILRRNRQHITIDETDLPVSQTYLDTLKKRGLTIVHTSKWLNGVTVNTADTALIKKISALSFVSTIQLTKPAIVLKSANQKFCIEAESGLNPVDYGSAYGQLSLLNGQNLHNSGFRGKGVHIAVLDAGFLNANTIQAFDSLRNSGRLLTIRDFVNPKSDIYQENYHGMSVLSCMTANIPGTIIGTAPDAAYYLFRTEDAGTEYIYEEDNWVAGAELADSLGVDIINSSLGYYEFDDTLMNHTYADMNGSKTRVTRAANMAFEKGILVFSSAGNEGLNHWKHIIAPADGINTIGVAAVDNNGARATFSSVGPAYGGGIKPNLAATGLGTLLITSDGNIGYANGTSFSSPVLAGMTACLKQAFPYATAKEIKYALEQSASQFSKPDSLLGYGIPNFEKAETYLRTNNAVSLNQINKWEVSPNPFDNSLVIKNIGTSVNQKAEVSLYNLQGICLHQASFGANEIISLTNLTNLPEGILILKINSGNHLEQFKLIKINSD
jgi:hypothetical protein